MLKPFANSARALASGPLTWRTWVGLILLPVLVVGLLTWAFWSPDTDHGTATAAVVNDDEPVKVNGQLVPLGRQLAGDLTHSESSAYKWVLTDAADAADGLAKGTYVASVTIPKDFSARATSVATGNPLDAAKARLTVRTSNAAGVADAVFGAEIARATQRGLNLQIVETYLDNLYVAFGTIHGQLGRAADGAGQLADGTGQLVTGSAELSSGAGRLATASRTLASGADSLADGLGQAERDTARLPELTRQLARGADQVADGNEEIADTVVPLANRIIAAIDRLPSAKKAAAKFQRLASQCASEENPQFCKDLRRVAAEFARDAGKIDGVRASVRAAAVDVRDSVQALAVGARRVANGNERLADAAGPLARGIASAASGARKVADGSGQVAAGAGDLAGGAKQLQAGVGRVDAGATRLATQLDKGRDQVPHYTPAEREHLKAVAAEPTTSTHDDVRIGILALTLIATLALWALALATYIVTRAVPDAVLTAREPTWRIIVRSAIPGATAAGLAAVAITAFAVPVLGLGFVETLGFLGVALLAAAAFVALNQAATAIFGRPGRLASIAVLVLTAATGIVSTLPGPLYVVGHYLPTYGATLALRATVMGGGGLVTGVVLLVTWLAIGSLATVFITDRRRYLNGKQLRLPVQNLRHQRLTA